MSLLKKAKKVRSHGEVSPTVVNPPEEIVFDTNSGISEEDQKEILAKIEQIAKQNRLTISPEILAVKAPKRGYFFPFLVNLSALAILAIGFLLLSAFFRQSESELRGEQGALKTAEAKLIQEIKKETEEQLKRKEQEINSIQSKLKEIDKERTELAANMNAKIKQREEELRKALENELAEERKRLNAQGLSAAAIEERLKKLEQEKNAQFNAQLEAYRRQAEAERAKMEADLAKLQNDFQRNLSTLTAERERILEESRKREASLQAQLEERTKALEQEKARSKTELSKAEAEIKSLQDQREKLQLVENQIMGYFTSIRGAIGEGNLDRAKELLGNLRTYLNDESIQRLSGMQQRREIDLLTVEALSVLIEGSLRRQRETTAVSEVLKAGALVEDIRVLVSQAQQAITAGNPQAAEQAYTQALGKVPEVLTAHQYFLTKQKQEEAARKQSIEQALSEAEDAFKQGAYRNAISAYTRAFSFLPIDRDRLDRTVTNVQKSGYELLFAEQKRLATLDAAAILTEGNRSLNEGRYSQAIASYLTLLQKYPQSAQAPQAIEGIRKAFDGQTSQMATRIAQLEGNINALQQEKSALEVSLQQLRETSGSRAEFNQQMEALKNQHTQEKNSLERAYQARIASLEQEITELRRQNAQLATTAQGGVIPQSTLEQLKRLEAIEREYNEVKAAYKEYTSKEDTLLKTKGSSGLVETKLYLDAFLASEQIRKSFPGFDLRIKQYDRAFQTAGRNAAYMEAADIVYQLSAYSTKSERTRFLNSLITVRKEEETVVDFLKTLRTLLD